MNMDLCISSVTLWEVFLNSDESRREYLLNWMQFSCANYLLKSPSEIIIDYINRQFPIKERMLFKEDPETKLALGQTWKCIHGKVDKTFNIDTNSIRERSEVIRLFSKKYSQFMEEMVATDNTNDPFHKMMLLISDSSPGFSNHKKRRIKTALVLAFFILCLGIELDNSCLEKFWKPIGIDSINNPFELRPFERLDFLIEKMPQLFCKGPLMEISNMMAIQHELGGRTNRGALFDSMHSLYAYFADNFITADSHFIMLQKHSDMDAYGSILHAEKYVAVYVKAKRLLQLRR